MSAVIEPKAIIFDLDGTLINSEPSHKEAELKTFEILGVPVTEDVLLPCTGLNLKAMLEVMNQTYGCQLTPEIFLEVEAPILGAMVGEQITVFEDANNLLDQLEGIPLGLCTSSLPWYVDIVLNRFPDLAIRFQSLVTAAEVTNSKPHPEAFQIACAKMGCEPHEVIAVEDSLNGLLSAKQAGCYTVGVDRLNRGHLNDHADLLLRRLDAMVEFL